MKECQHFLLQGGPEVDHQVAATDQVQLGERRIFRHVLPREDAAVANGLVDSESTVAGTEETAQSLRRYFGRDTFRIYAAPRPLNRRFAQIGPEDLSGTRRAALA